MLTHLSNGYSNAEALRMATSGNAELLQLSSPRNPYQGKICILAEGALADLLVVAGNPLGDIKFLEDRHKNFAVIMKGGRRYKKARSKNEIGPLLFIFESS